MALLLLPLAALCLALHTREVVRSGTWQSPVYALAGPEAGSYPRVGGETAEILGAPHDLEVGDVLVRAGDRDLRGHGYLGFLGRAYEEADAEGRVPLEIERRGQRMRAELQLAPFPFAWTRVPFLSLLLLFSAFIAWRLPHDVTARWMIVTFSTIIIGEAIFEGVSLTQTVVAKCVFIFGGVVWVPLLMHLLAYVPARGDERPMPWLIPGMVISAGAWLLPKLQYLLGSPAPASIPSTVAVGDALGIAIPFAFFIANYRRSDEAKRRSLRWVFHSTFVSAAIMGTAVALPALAPGTPLFGQAIAVAGVGACIIPVGLFISMTAYDLFDIDRVISAAAVYSGVVIGFLAVLLAGVPALAGWFAPLHDFDPEASRLVLSVLAAALAVPAAQWLRPRIDDYFFPERRRVESGFDRLLAEQTLESSAAGVAQRVAERVRESFDSRFSEVFRREGDHFVPPSRSELEPLDAGESLLTELGSGNRPLVLDDRQGAGLRVDDPEGIPVSLREAETALLLPIRDGGELAALVVVGRKRSDDVYTGAELSLMGACLDAGSRHLDRVREAEERQRVEAAHLTRSRHLAAASHDLRQPLHALRLSAEALGDRVSDPEAREIAERIRTSAGSLHEMFDTLIDLARLDQGTLPVSVQAFALAPLLERLRTEAEPLAAAKGLALSIETADVWATSDPILVGRVLQNLLVNAIRYTAEGSVVLRARDGGGGVAVEVTDTGPGIPPGRREEVFGEFVRLDPQGAEPGLGLGLSIVRRLCERLDHALELESEPGRGTTFRVTLPAAEARAAEAPVRGADLAGRHVLVVDDDLAVLASMRSLLEGWGAAVVLATDRAEALEAARTGKFDAVVADYRLGGGDLGPGVVRALRDEVGRELPALVVTGSQEREVLDDIAAHGLAGLPKPVSPARLRATLAAVLRTGTAAGRR